MVGRYVVGVDGSGPAEAALTWAIARAEREGVPVVIVHVDELEDGIMGRDFREAALQAGRELVASTEERVRKSHPRLELSSALLEGSPSWALADFTRPDDTLVIGTHKTGYLNGRVLGSRSVQIAMRCQCTVAVIPIADLRFRTGVVAGVDRDATAAGIGRLAAEEAAARGDDLVLLHATIEEPNPTTTRQRMQVPIKIAMAAAREQAPSLTVRSRVSTRPPAEALLDASRGKALLVLGPGSLDPSRSPIGSVVHEILLNANAPLLIARTLAPAEAPVGVLTP